MRRGQSSCPRSCAGVAFSLPSWGRDVPGTELLTATCTPQYPVLGGIRCSRVSKNGSIISNLHKIFLTDICNNIYF